MGYGGLRDKLREYYEMYWGIKYSYPRVKRRLGERVTGFIQLMRPFTLLAAFIAGFSLNYLFATMSGRETTIWFSTLVGLILALIQGGGQALNQSLLVEIEIDKVNGKTYRPTITGVIDPEEGKIFSFILFLLGVSMAFFIHKWLGVFAFLIALFAVTYSAPPLRVKEKFFFNNLHQAIARGFLPAVYVASAYDYGLIAVLFGIPLTIWATGAQGTKDFGDERGDEKFGVMTFPVKLGRERAIKWIWKLMLLGFLTLNLFVLLNLLPISFAILNILVIPSMLIPITLKMNIKIEKMENTASWVLFYGTLGLWYLLPPLLV